MEECSLNQCDICDNILTDPRILPCSHNFCLKCLQASVISTGSSKCPTCRIEFQIPKKGLKYLRNKEFGEQVGKTVRSNKQSNIKCDSCTENQASEFCIDCSFNYCSICLDHHGRIPTSKNHRLKSTRPTQDAFEFKIPTCTEHSEIITLICEDCRVLSCTQCSVLRHNNHKIRNISKYFESLKTEIEEKLKIEEAVISNFNEATDTRYDIELKASKLKKEIKKRGDDLKKVVDSIVAKLIKDVDEELMQHLKDADDVMKELKNMEAILKEQIESLKQQLNNLKYDNVVETSVVLPEKKEKIPEYSELFKVSLYSDINDLNTHLKTIFGTLTKAPKFRLVKEIKVNSAYTSFASNHDNVYLCNSTDSKIDVFDSIGMDFKSSYNFKDVTSNISGLLVINEMLFVLGFENKMNDNINSRSQGMFGSTSNTGNTNNNNIKIIKIDYLLKCQPVVIYKIPNNQDACKLSRSYCQECILLILNNSLILLSQNGVVRKSIDLKFICKNALQLVDQNYVVCSQNCDVRIINDCGVICWKYSPTNDCHKFTSPCLAVDNFGNIYMGGKNVVVFNRHLEFKSLHVLHHTNESILNMCYCEVKNELLVLVQLSDTLKLMWFKV